MKIIVDTNIIFSSLLRADNKEIDLLLSRKFKFFIPKALLIELFAHKDKLVKYSKLKEHKILEILAKILKSVEIISEEDIPLFFRKQAYDLVKDIDERDVFFVALALFLNAKLWTGDKKLKQGLEKKNVKIIITTNELLKIMQEDKNGV